MFETSQGVIKPIVYVGIQKNQKLLLVQYQVAPNPRRTGWWIPAPELKFGEDPQERARQVAKDLGLKIEEIRLREIESFTTPGGWHLISHFSISTNSEPQLSPEIVSFRWVSEKELEQMPDIAHGDWEIAVGKKFLKS